MIVVTSNTEFRSIVNEQIRGRVTAIRIMTFTGSFPLGALLQGPGCPMPPALVSS